MRTGRQQWKLIVAGPCLPATVRLVPACKRAVRRFDLWGRSCWRWLMYVSNFR